jgi:hypothetical protein
MFAPFNSRRNFDRFLVFQIQTYHGIEVTLKSVFLTGTGTLGAFHTVGSKANI